MSDTGLPPIFFSGEVQLHSWKDSHTQGPVISFRLEDSDALSPFRAETVAKGNQAGELYRMILVKIGDQGEPVPPPTPAPTAAPKPLGPLCKEAISLCVNSRFFDFMVSWLDEPVQKTEAAAKEFVLRFCGVTSRKQLDESIEAGDQFRELRRQFQDWVREQRERDS